MRIDVSAYPPTVGRAIHRVSAALSKHAPPEVTIVGPNQEADVQVIQYWTSDILLPQYRTAPKHAVIYHCTNRLFPDTHPFLSGMPAEFVRDALLVVSWQPLPEGDKYLMLPLGADPSIWFKEDTPKTQLLLTTGYVADQEYIAEAYRAVRANNGMMVHVGGDCISGPGLIRVEGISDEMMRRFYNSSCYVSGLRKDVGFELPALEATFCGVRPLILDRPDQKWLRPWSQILHEGTPAEVEEQLTEVLSKPPVPLTEEERQEAIATLSWEPIAKAFWANLMERL